MKRRNAGDWTDAAESDPGIALLELFAYLGDLLGFRQEQIATEARLKTRRRYLLALAVALAFICWRHRTAE
jgi:hypothetical protein